eukprot:gene1093-biopygen941
MDTEVAFVHFCAVEGRSWLPATEVPVRYIARLMAKGTVKAASLQPYLSTINNYHEGMRHNDPAKGRSAARAVKGMTSLQVQGLVSRLMRTRHGGGYRPSTWRQHMPSS